MKNVSNIVNPFLILCITFCFIMYISLFYLFLLSAYLQLRDLRKRSLDKVRNS